MSLLSLTLVLAHLLTHLLIQGNSQDIFQDNSNKIVVIRYS